MLQERLKIVVIATIVTSIFSGQVLLAESPKFTKARKNMVQKQLRTRNINDEKVLNAMGKVPRHEFVSKFYSKQAYDDHPLPIGHGQTISQPYIVALMTQLLKLKPDEKVLEIGTGSGYQAAILAELTKEVYTVEIIKELKEKAEKSLKKQEYKNIKLKSADGYYGWKKYAPFDAIIVTAAPEHIPQPLIQQLKDGGRMVIPVGPQGNYQTLWLLEKKGEKLEFHNISPVMFVPLTRQ